MKAHLHFTLFPALAQKFTGTAPNLRDAGGLFCATWRGTPGSTYRVDDSRDLQGLDPNGRGGHRPL